MEAELTKPARTRVQIDLAPQSYERLKRLKDVTEASSYTDVLKDALRIYEYLVESADRGERLSVTDAAGRTTDLRLFN